MLATASDLPGAVDDYGFEYKWDGVRTAVRHTAGELRLWSRNRNDMADRFAFRNAEKEIEAEA